MEIERAEMPDMDYAAVRVLDGLPYGHSRDQAIAALSNALRNAWLNGYSNGEGDILAAEADNAYRQFGEFMTAIVEGEK